LIDFNARINQLMRIDSMNTRIKSFKESNTWIEAHINSIFHSAKIDLRYRQFNINALFNSCNTLYKSIVK
jgi:hypothetical protein